MQGTITDLGRRTNEIAESVQAGESDIMTL